MSLQFPFTDFHLLLYLLIRVDYLVQYFHLLPRRTSSVWMGSRCLVGLQRLLRGANFISAPRGREQGTK